MKQVGKMEEQYKKTGLRLMKAMEWLDGPERTKEEVNQWYPRYKQLFDQTTNLEKELRKTMTQEKFEQCVRVIIKALGELGEPEKGGMGD